MKILLLFCLTFVLSTKTVNAQTEITFYTTIGDFVVEAYDTLQPITAGNFIDLVNAEFYDGIIFHRVISGFMIQGGDPLGTGSGGPGYSIPDEFDTLTSNVQKAISMANSGPNTGGSQFFINLVDNLYLDPDFPVFGIVTSNFSVVQSIGLVPTDFNDKPLTDVIMDSVRVTLVGPHVGINALEKPSLNINIFPNPSDDYISITIDDQTTYINDYLLKITNLLGQTVYSEYLIHQNTTVDVSNIAREGVYFINVLDEQTKNIVVKKIVLR
jgi:peptidylprolyl isomerase